MRYVIRFKGGNLESLIWFFNNKKSVEEENFRGAVCYEIPDSIDIDDLIELQILGKMQSNFKKLWENEI